MKKFITAVLLLALCLSLTGCGKSEEVKNEEVKNVESMIKGLGEVTADSLEAVFAAREAYDALSEEEQAKVRNIDELKDAYSECVEMHLPGNWVYDYGHYSNVTEQYEKVDLSISQDLYAEAESYAGPCWVEDFRLAVDSGEYNHVQYLHYEDGQLTMGTNNYRLIKTEAYAKKLDEMFLTVELTPENVADYCNIIIYTEIKEDAFGVVTGDTRTYATLESKVYDDGLIYFEDSDDLAVELLMEEHPYTYIKGNRVRKYTDEADKYVIQHGPYGTSAFSLGNKQAEDGYEYVHDITAEQISFGRVAGSITFIRAEYVQDVYKDPDSSSRRILLTNGEELYAGTWKEDVVF